MVYVTQEAYGKNLLPAKDFGPLCVLLGPTQLVLDTGFAVSELKKKLGSFSDNDYLLPIGDPVAIGLATHVAASYNHGRVKFLKWDRQEQRYYSVQSNLGES